MNLDWPDIPLNEVLAEVIDYRGKSPRKSSSGVPVISAKVVKAGRIAQPIEQTISPDYYDEWMRRGLPQSGDVVMTTEGPLGEVAQLDQATARYALGQRIVVLRGRPGTLDNTYLRFALQGPEMQRRLESRATGTTVLGISQKSLLDLPIPVPPLPEQQAIAAVLGALDDKIELNRRMNRTLEAMARALFRSWFVDFDPVRAKAEGRAPAHMDPATAALFPARLGENDLPEGWRRNPLSTICAASKASIDPREHKDALFDHFSIPAFDAGAGPVRQPGAEIMSNKLVVPDGAILFSRLNPSIPRVWWARTRKDVFASVGSTEYLVAQPRHGTASSFLYSLLVSDDFRAEVVARVTGTSNSHQRVKPGSVLEIEVVVPSAGVVTAFGDLTQPWFDRVQASLEQSRTLAALRDTLLPKLMSGELRVRDAGRAVAAVA